jgi:hypothetical protein
MKTPHINGLLFVLSITCVASCQYDPHAHRYTTAKPLHRELVGTYVLQSETILQADSSELNGRQCIVELKADGTFTAANVPPLNSDPGPGFVARLRSGSGKWRVDPVGRVDGGWESKTVWGVYLDSPSELGPAHIAGRTAPYGLIFSVGDPDSGEVLVLKRTM